jgi:hypothetical protein
MTSNWPIKEAVMRKQHRLGLGVLICGWIAWSVTALPATVRAGSVSLEAISEATRTDFPFPAPGTASFSPGLPGLLQASLDGRTPFLIDSALQFNLGSIPQGAVITSATLSLSIAGTQSSVSQPALTVSGFGSNTGAVQLSNFDGGRFIGSIESASLPANSGAPNALNLPLQFDVGSFIQSLVNSNTEYAGFVLDDPHTSSVFVWGSAASDPGESPNLAINFSVPDPPASVPEPPSALLMLLGALGLGVVGAWRHGRASSRR